MHLKVKPPVSLLFPFQNKEPPVEENPPQNNNSFCCVASPHKLKLCHKADTREHKLITFLNHSSSIVQAATYVLWGHSRRQSSHDFESKGNCALLRCPNLHFPLTLKTKTGSLCITLGLQHHYKNGLKAAQYKQAHLSIYNKVGYALRKWEMYLML